MNLSQETTALPLAVPRFCVISSNWIAKKYLSSLLCQGGEFSPLSLSTEDLFQCKSEFPNPVFVVDCTFLRLPLSAFISRLKAKFPTAYYVVVDKELTESEIRLLLSQGIQGFVAEHQIEERLVQAVRTVLAGGLWVPEKVFQASAQSLPPAHALRTRSVDVSATTRRETEVLELVRRRLSNREIGGMLKIAESTVKYHISNLFSKLQVTSRHQLARSHGILEPLIQLI